MSRICVSILLLCVSFLAFAQDSSEDLFQKGLAAYQNRKYDEARDHFEKIVQEGKGTARVMHNLALTYYQLNQKPHAAALWRKALAMDPGFSAARTGRDLMESRFSMRPLERNSVSAGLRGTLEYLSFFEILWLLALALSIAGWMWIRYFGDRRTALDTEQPLPPFPTSAVLVSTALLAVGVLAVLKAGQQFSVRATVVTEKAAVRSLPTDDGAALFEVGGGSEVLVRRKNDGWIQVQAADGGTGWVKSSEILITSGE